MTGYSDAAPDAVPDPALVLVKKLLRASVAGQVKWEKTGLSAFQADVGDTEIYIFSKDNDGLAPYGMNIADLGSPDDGDYTSIASSLLRGAAAEEFNQTLSRLYEVAERSALNQDQRLTRLLAELDRLSDD